jgi:DNA-binding MarR family transcriptional regulator
MSKMEKQISQKLEIVREIPFKTSHAKDIHSQAKILYALICASGPLNFKELEERAGVDGTTLYRQIPILVKRGYIKMLKETRRLSRQKFAIGTYTPELDEETKNEIMLLLEEVHHRGLNEVSIQWLAAGIKKPINGSARLFIYEEARKRGIRVTERGGYAIP